MTNLININGRINSGKDTVGKIIQCLTAGYDVRDTCIAVTENDIVANQTDWEIKKYAAKLKQIVAILIGCTEEDLEDRDFKGSELGEQWDRYKLTTYYISETLDSEYFDENEDSYLFGTEKAAIEYAEHNKKQLHIPDEHKKYGNSGDFSYKIEKEKLTPRLLLQLIGTDAARDIIHPDIWLNALFSDYVENAIRCNNCYWKGNEDDLLRLENEDGALDGCPNCKTDNYLMDLDTSKWIITDSRFPNDADYVKKLDGINIRVERNLPKVENEHFSEKALDGYKFDYVIDNLGSIEDLIEKVREILIKEKIIKQ